LKIFGFSTGALAKGDVGRALSIAEEYQTQAVEYSALRLNELEPLANFLMQNGTGDYRHVSFHAPSRFERHEERAVVDVIRNLLVKFSMSIVVHPDVIYDYALWRPFGGRICIENMDHRKPVGRTPDELADVFTHLPDARLCFDIGHAHEIDRSMSLGYSIVKRFRNRIAHIHASEVSDDCSHRGFSASSHAAFLKLADLFEVSTPVILEAEVSEREVDHQLKEAISIFQGSFAIKTTLHSLLSAKIHGDMSSITAGDVFELLTKTLEVLRSGRGEGCSIRASLVKQTIKRYNPDFNECAHGFPAFKELLLEAQKRGLLKLEDDKQAGTYIVHAVE